MAQGPSGQFSSQRRLGLAKQHEYTIVDSYKLTYRNREDVTNLPPGVLIIGSQNVISNVSERIQIRQGYALDGATSGTAAAVLASFDWLTRGNNEKHVRAGGLTMAGNDGSLQYRYVDGSQNVTWRDLMTGLTNVNFNFDTFWRTDESLRVMLFVNGDGVVHEWNGAVTTLASATSNTITKTGTNTWEDEGFYVSTTPRSVVINNNTYAYTGGETTTTITGVSPSPAAEAVGSVIHQALAGTAVAAMTGITATFTPNLIRTLNNQVFLAYTKSSVVWISKVNDYTDYSSSNPRQTGEGATLILDSQIVGMDPQENFMYITAGQDLWYNVSFTAQTSTVGVSYESVGALPLKTGRRQAAFSQAALSHMKNNIIVVTQETTIDTFGRVETSLATPQQVNISDSIKLDIDSYDFTDCSIAYHRMYIYVAVPREGLVLMYSLTTKSWEAPQTLPISRFYVVDGDLYGHSYSTFESYKLFTGYADRVYPGFGGFPIAAKWVFSYMNFGARFAFKKATKSFVEGYIDSNTTLNFTLTYELDGCKTVKNFSLDGSNNQFVCVSGAEGSLGKESLGKVKLGGDKVASINGLPPKFRWFPTFSNTDFYEVSPSFSVLGVDQRMELISFGLAASGSSEIDVQRMD